jgi:hypothetical protein
LAAIRHGAPLFNIGLRVMSCFRMQAVNANFFAFPSQSLGVRREF